MMQTKTDTTFGLTFEFDVLVKPTPIPFLSLEICRVITVRYSLPMRKPT